MKIRPGLELTIWFRLGSFAKHRPLQGICKPDCNDVPIYRRTNRRLASRQRRLAMVITKSLGTDCAEVVLIFSRPFFIQFPVAIVGLALVIWKLPEPRPSLKTRHHSNNASALQRIDFAGAFALVGVIVSGLLSVDIATKGGWSWLAAVLVSCFGGSLFAFIAIEKYCAREPIFPLKLLTNQDLLTSYAVTHFQAAGQFGVSLPNVAPERWSRHLQSVKQLLYAIPIYFQVVGRESISISGTRILPIVLGNASGTVLSGHFITRYKRYKVMTAIGNVVGFVGFLIIFLRWRGSTRWYESVFVALPGMGMGIMQSTTFVHLAASLEQSEIAIAGSSWFLAQNVGILIGSSLSTATINRRTSALLDTYLDGIEDKEEVSDRDGNSI